MAGDYDKPLSMLMLLLSSFYLDLGLIPASRISVLADACLVGGPQISPENVAPSNCLPCVVQQNDLKTGTNMT